MHSSPLKSLFQLIPTRGAELLWITSSHDLLLAEHTLRPVEGGGRGAQDWKYKKIFKFKQIALENIFNAISEGNYNSNISDIEQSC